MEWPARVQFGAVEIEIELCSREDFDNEEIGNYRIRNGVPTVRIARELAGDLFTVTLIHELVHAWLGLSGLKLDEDKEEPICDAIAHGVAQYLGALDEAKA